MFPFNELYILTSNWKMCNLHVDKYYNRFIRFLDQSKAFCNSVRVIEDDTISFLPDVLFRFLSSLSFVVNLSSSLCQFLFFFKVSFPFFPLYLPFSLSSWYYKCTYDMNNLVLLPGNFTTNSKSFYAAISDSGKRCGVIELREVRDSNKWIQTRGKRNQE